MERYQAARGAVAAGVATVALTLWFASVEAVDCGNGPISGISALSGFQMAKSQAMLDAAIGCTKRLAVLDSMNRVDLLAYIASWGLMMALGAMALASGRLKRVALLCIGLAVVADIVETATQLWIGTTWPFVSQTMLVALAVGSTVKWAGIAGGLGAIGASAARDGRRTTRWLGVAVAILGLLGLTVLVAPQGSTPPFTAIAFLLLIAACAAKTVRRA
jgi:hypothetical protein